MCTRQPGTQVASRWVILLIVHITCTLILFENFNKKIRVCIWSVLSANEAFISECIPLQDISITLTSCHTKLREEMVGDNLQKNCLKVNISTQNYGSKLVYFDIYSAIFPFFSVKLGIFSLSRAQSVITQ